MVAPHAWCEVLCRSRAIVGVAPQSVSTLCGALRRSVTAPLFAPHNVVRSLFACTWMSILRIEPSSSRACAASRTQRSRAPRLGRVHVDVPSRSADPSDRTSSSRASAASCAALRLRPVCAVALGRSRSKEPRSPSWPRARGCAFAVHRSVGSNLARVSSLCGVLRRAATAPSVRRRAWEVALKGAALQGVSPSALDSSSCRLLGRDAGPCTLRSRCARARLPQWRCRPPPLWSLPRRRSPPSVFLFRHVKDVPPLARQCGTLSGCAYASALVCGGVSCVCPVRCRRAGLFSVRRWSYHSSRAALARARAYSLRRFLYRVTATTAQTRERAVTKLRSVSDSL